MDKTMGDQGPIKAEKLSLEIGTTLYTYSGSALPFGRCGEFVERQFTSKFISVLSPFMALSSLIYPN